MRRLLTVLALVAVLVLAGCGDGSDDTTTTGTGGDDPPPAAGSLDTEIVYLGEGEPPFDGPPGVQVLDPADADAAAALFVEGEREAAAAAVTTAGLDGRTLLGGLVHEGCFSAGGVSVDVVDDAVVFTAEDLDPQEGEVDCARAVVTSAIVSVATDALPDGVGGGRTTEPGSTEPADELGEAVLIEPARHEASDVAGPGLVRDRVDLEAVLGRYGLGDPDPGLLARLESGQSVLVAGVVGGSCELPVDVTVRRTGDDLQLVEEYDPDAPEVVCDEAVQGLALVALDPAEVEGATTVGGDPIDGPTGVGAVLAVEPLGVDAEPLAQPFELLQPPNIPPGAADMDLPATPAGAVRLMFVVEACQPDTAELVADLAAGTVRAEAQQSGDRVDCDALGPHLVIADLAADHADLDPVIA